MNSIPDAVFLGTAAGEAVGSSVGYAGDMNGDGFGDLVAGSCAPTGPRKTAQATLRPAPGGGGSHTIVDNKAACTNCRITFKVTLAPIDYLALV